jgi:hypothetical protein
MPLENAFRAPEGAESASSSLPHGHAGQQMSEQEAWSLLLA